MEKVRTRYMITAGTRIKGLGPNHPMGSREVSEREDWRIQRQSRGLLPPQPTAAGHCLMCDRLFSEAGKGHVLNLCRDCGTAAEDSFRVDGRIPLAFYEVEEDEEAWEKSDRRKLG